MKSGDLDLIAFKSVPAIELLDNIYGANESDNSTPRLAQWHFDFQMKYWIDKKVNCEYGLEAVKMEMDYSNRLHTIDAPASAEPTLTPELVNAHFAVASLDNDHLIGLYHQGELVAPFTVFTTPEIIRTTCAEHLKSFHGVC